MSKVFVRNLDAEVIESLKARAIRQCRSLQAESRVILESAAAERVLDIAEARVRADRIRQGLGDGLYSDSAAILREERDR